MKRRASLIISTYNWPSALKVCLKSVLGQSCLPAEVIIADDGSSSETREIIDGFRGRFPVPLIHVWQEDRGFRKTIILNKAVRRSSFEYIIQIDGDVILEKHFIEDHVTCAEQKAFIRGSRAMLTPEKSEELLNSGNIKINFWSKGIIHRNNALRIPALRWLGIRKEKNSEKVRGSNISFWKADFIKVNGYNNQLAGWGHEDEELAARFINSGIIKKIVKLAAVQYHLYHANTTKDLKHLHVDEIKRVVQNKIKVCNDGYTTINDE